MEIYDGAYWAAARAFIEKYPLPHLAGCLCIYCVQGRQAAKGGENMSHTCHATGCPSRVPPEMWGCKRHWFMVPKPIRDQIWRTYRVGQCDDYNPSKEYLLAARDAVIAVARKEGIEPDTRLYDRFLELEENKTMTTNGTVQETKTADKTEPKKVHRPLRELFSEYEATDALVAEARAAVDAAIVVRSKAIKAIADAIAPNKRIKKKDGTELVIVTRKVKTKGEDGQESEELLYSIRGTGQPDAAVKVED